MSYKTKKHADPIKYQSANLEIANHKNKIELRSLRVSLESLHKDNLIKLKQDFNKLRGIRLDLNQLNVSTGCVKSKVFESTKFGKLMLPIKREILPVWTEKNILIRPMSHAVKSKDELEITKLEPETPLSIYRAPAKNPEMLRLEKIESLKKRDIVFRKRIEQFAIFKNIKKAPVFDEEKRVEDTNVPKTLKIRDRREMMDILEKDRNNKPNPHKLDQLKLDRAVKDFVKEQIDNAHLYNGTTPPRPISY